MCRDTLYASEVFASLSKICQELLKVANMYGSMEFQLTFGVNIPVNYGDTLRILQC